MVYFLEFLPDAKAEIERELSYSRRQWGKAHAGRYRKEMMACIRGITRNPMQYALKSDYGEGMRGVACRGNWVFYRVNEKQKIVQIIGFPSIYRNVHYDAT